MRRIEEGRAMRTSRPFQLMVDSGNREEPSNRYFGSLEAALAAAEELPARFHPFVWISEFLTTGGRITHVRDGRRTT